MKGRLIAITVFLAAGASAQSGFVWDYSGRGASYPPYTWPFTGNGDLTLAASSGGSSIYQNTVTGTSSNDYEVQTPIFSNGGGGTYMHFLRASTTALPGTGSYVSVELAVPSTWQTGGAVALSVNQCASGSVTLLGGASVGLHTGDVLRSIVWGTNLWVFLNNLQVGVYTIPSTTGQPGFGGHDVPSGSWIMNPYSTTQTGFVKIGHHETVAPGAVPVSTAATSLLPNSVSLKWQGVSDDSVGIGVFQYIVTRGGTSRTLTEPEFTDATVAPATSYTYSVQANRLSRQRRDGGNDYGDDASGERGGSAAGWVVLDGKLLGRRRRADRHAQWQLAFHDSSRDGRGSHRLECAGEPGLRFAELAQ